MALFRFKRFDVDDRDCGQKICSDSVLLGAWFLSAHIDAKSVLDVGTGSGLFALMATDMLPGASVTAVELEAEAAAAAKHNFEASPWASRLKLLEGDFHIAHQTDGYDLIICNPPFFSNGERAENHARASARHEDTLSYSSLIDFASDNLAHDGHLGLIAPADREQEIIFHGELAGLSLRRLCRVHTSSQKPATRILMDFSRTPGAQQTQKLAIRESSGAYSDSYLSLVSDIYLTLK